MLKCSPSFAGISKHHTYMLPGSNILYVRKSIPLSDGEKAYNSTQKLPFSKTCIINSCTPFRIQPPYPSHHNVACNCLILMQWEDICKQTSNDSLVRSSLKHKCSQYYPGVLNYGLFVCIKPQLIMGWHKSQRKWLALEQAKKTYVNAVNFSRAFEIWLSH